MKRVYIEALVDEETLRDVAGDTSISVESQVKSEFNWLKDCGISFVSCSAVEEIPEDFEGLGNGVLTTGRKFHVVTPRGKAADYAFIGFDIVDRNTGTGCQYIVLQNLTTHSYTRVEAAWFCMNLTNRKITLLE